MNRHAVRKERKLLLLGLMVLALYWLWVRPPGFARGYIEDFCAETSLHLIAHSIDTTGLPSFTTDRYMAPYGTAVPFLSWSIERDWLGSYVWKWNHEFPILWVYQGLSFLLTFLGLGFLLRKLGIIASWRWLLAAGFVVMNVPRHYKLWHHHEYQTLHWVYLSLFLDAWIWQRFIKERRWSWVLELWRGVCLLGMMGTAGYFWGPLALEWLLVRLGMLLHLRITRPRIVVEGSWRRSLLPSALILMFVTVEITWFLPLFREVRKLGSLQQPLEYFAKFRAVFRPLWIDPLYNFVSSTWNSAGWNPLPTLSPINSTETVVAIGWIYWVPILLGLRAKWAKSRLSGLWIVAPFVAFLAIGVGYFSLPVGNHAFARAIQATIPMMSFFRVASRWGLLLTPIAAVIVVLCWQEILSQTRKAMRTPLFRKAAIAWGVLSLLEVGILLRPVNALPPLDESTVRLLEAVRQAPGDTVLDLPFCTAGANGVCSAQQCPNYPKSTVGQCFANWHEKKVYGLYQGRMVPSQCTPYDREPYQSWFQAWSEQRCFTPSEWQDFCDYLRRQSNIAAVLVYPDVWKGAATPTCQSDFRRHLGEPIQSGTFSSTPTLGGAPSDLMNVVRYPSQCKR